MNVYSLFGLICVTIVISAVWLILGEKAWQKVISFVVLVLVVISFYRFYESVDLLSGDGEVDADTYSLYLLDVKVCDTEHLTADNIVNIFLKGKGYLNSIKHVENKGETITLSRDDIDIIEVPYYNPFNIENSGTYIGNVTDGYYYVPPTFVLEDKDYVITYCPGKVEYAAIVGITLPFYTVTDVEVTNRED